MEIKGLHLLLTYQCTLECDHCFVWGSPQQSGTMTLEIIQRILQQAKEARTVESIYFEGGEPFLYYATLLSGVRLAHEMGFQVGIVTNGYWSTSGADALEALRPFAGLVQDLSLSSDLFHYSEVISQRTPCAQAAADELGIPQGVISIAQPQTNTSAAVGQLPEGEGKVMFRGRAADKLAPQVPHLPWEAFTTCPFEDLRDPGRVHVDAFGNLHICQGIVIGNLFQESLTAICQRHDPELHYITGPLLVGGPAQLVRTYGLEHDEAYADACHLCYSSRLALRKRFPNILAPNQMYGVEE